MSCKYIELEKIIDFRETKKYFIRLKYVESEDLLFYFCLPNFKTRTSRHKYFTTHAI